MNGKDWDEPQQRQEREQMKVILSEELDHLHFIGQKQVLQRTHPNSMLTRLQALWNKELELPVVPIAAIIAVMVGTLVIGKLRGTPDAVPSAVTVHRVLVKEGENYYWQDELKRAVASIEVDNTR